ncbi:hypothetical protein BVC80_6817g1 [Macleaya cordata]|uniref:Uncharacterized protein n=1 Tax=Macleaya cordata TaxID=56857 RepID=A0A200PY49_MACCD|nr:hypothetical protein BVC80_6817g1 [Macleaya cordata]
MDATYVCSKKKRHRTSYFIAHSHRKSGTRFCPDLVGVGPARGQSFPSPILGLHMAFLRLENSFGNLFQHHFFG